MKVLSIVGARPEFVQAAPVSRALRPRHEEILVHTGQHYDYEMSAVFFRQLGLPAPDHNLGVGSGSHAWQTGQMLVQLEQVLAEEQPDWVIVRGDTNSTLAGALVAVKLGLPLAHVEAGLRSFDRTMPEEINRVLTDRIADALFCPTDAAVRNLSAEGIDSGVYQVGDVMLDGLLHNLSLAEARSTILVDLNLAPGRYLLATVHRAANTDVRENLAAILSGFGQADEPIVFPAHPRTRKQMSLFGLDVPPNVRLSEPLSYFDVLILQKHARLLLTDSGGMQKEAYCLGTPCVTLREQTEWVETVEVGWNVLVGADAARIVAAVRSFTPPAERPALYGDGRAAEHIVATLEQVTKEKA
jgi:UDP-GlcNAc3NAcA epimerase